MSVALKVAIFFLLFGCATQDVSKYFTKENLSFSLKYKNGYRKVCYKVPIGENKTQERCVLEDPEKD